MQCLISVAVLEHLHLPLHPDTQRDSHALSIDVAVPAGGEWCGGKCYMFDSTQYIRMKRQALVGRELPAIPGYLDPDANFDEETHMITNCTANWCESTALSLTATQSGQVGSL
jgi:hypothetical protein